MNSFRYKCSTPQKQPAATVAFAAPSGNKIGLPPPFEFTPRAADELKGRNRREMKGGIADAMGIARMQVKRKRLVKGDVILLVFGFTQAMGSMIQLYRSSSVFDRNPWIVFVVYIFGEFCR